MNEPWTIGRLLDWTAKHFAQNGSEFPRLDSEVLLAHALGCKRIELYTRYEEEASEETRGKFRELIRKRLEGCPVAYLVGRKEFFSLVFEISPAVLIPRPESEFVVMECLRLAKGPPPQPSPARGEGGHLLRILDIGTGSGNIAVSVAKRLPKAEVTAVDRSAEALAVAARNAQRHEVAGRIRFLQGDLFEPIPPGEQFDFILSNPPYIANEELDKLPVGVRQYEPLLALDGGPGGYAVLDRLIAQAGAYLHTGGYLILEIGAPQEQPVRQRLGALPGFELADTVHDYSGHPRVLVARRLK